MAGFCFKQGYDKETGRPICSLEYEAEEKLTAVKFCAATAKVLIRITKALLIFALVALIFALTVITMDPWMPLIQAKIPHLHHIAESYIEWFDFFCQWLINTYRWFHAPL